jgi:ribose transport system permease protein
MHRRNARSGGGKKAPLGAFSHSLSVVIIYAVLLAMLLVLGLVSPGFPSVALVNSLVISALPLVFAALAQTLVVLVKGIDLSVGPVISLVMVVAASLMRDSGWSIAGVVVLCVLIGMAAGAINGALVVFARLQSIIVTLATSLVFGGLALYVMPQPGGYIPEALSSFVTGNLGVVPNAVLILAASLLVLWLPARKSRIGQGWYAVGGNETGAFYSGVDVAKAKMSAFLLAGVFASLAGLALAAQTMTGDPAIGAPYTLNSIASTVLGGTSLSGGIGGAIGAIGGAFVLTVVVDILFFFRVSAYYQYVFSGAIVILALAIVTISESLQSRRAIAVSSGGERHRRGGRQ